MRRAINDELNSIMQEIEEAHANTQELLRLLETNLEDIFKHLHGRIEGEEVVPGTQTAE
jgi:hypothetical protein